MHQEQCESIGMYQEQPGESGAHKKVKLTPDPLFPYRSFIKWLSNRIRVQIPGFLHLLSRSHQSLICELLPAWQPPLKFVLHLQTHGNHTLSSRHPSRLQRAKHPSVPRLFHPRHRTLGPPQRLPANLGIPALRPRHPTFIFLVWMKNSKSLRCAQNAQAE